MKVEIVSKEENPLLKRKEVTFRIDHHKVGGTPTRKEVKELLANLLKTDLELIYLKNLKTQTGTTVAVGKANAYESVEQANLIEPKYIIARNPHPEKQKETEEAPSTEEAEESEATVEAEEKKKPKKTPEPIEKEGDES